MYRTKQPNIYLSRVEALADDGCKFERKRKARDGNKQHATIAGPGLDLVSFL